MIYIPKLKRLLLIIAAIPLLMSGQLFQHYSRHLTTRNGLPSNTVYAIIQDKSGAIYIGHEEGVSRYNGSKFQNFKNPGIGKSLSDPVETDNGDILASSFYGDIVKTLR